MTEDALPAKIPMDPVRKWTLIVLSACVVLMFWYLVADRVTPYTTQARVHALVVPVASQVSGVVVDVFVANNEYVEAGQELFRIDPGSLFLGLLGQRALIALANSLRELE